MNTWLELMSALYNSCTVCNSPKPMFQLKGIQKIKLWLLLNFMLWTTQRVTEIESDGDSEREEESNAQISLAWRECAHFSLIPPESWQVETKGETDTDSNAAGARVRPCSDCMGIFPLLSFLRNGSSFFFS